MEQLRSSMTAFVQLAQRFEVSAFTPSAIAHMQRISDRLAQMRGHIAQNRGHQPAAAPGPHAQQGSAHTYGGSNLAPAQPPRWHGCTMLQRLIQRLKGHSTCRLCHKGKPPDFNPHSKSRSQPPGPATRSHPRAALR